LKPTLERPGCREKNGRGREADLLPGVAALHLTRGVCRYRRGNPFCAKNFPEERLIARSSWQAVGRTAMPPDTEANDDLPAASFREPRELRTA
jgi:hypothetical protein